MNNFKDYAIFVALTPNFMKWANALLNSIEKRIPNKKNVELTVYLLHHDGVNKRWLNDVQKAFYFKIIPVEMKRSEVPAPPECNRTEFVKRARFFYILKYGYDYDICCLLDCDMFLVSSDFMKLFDLVFETKLLIGCNERYKWHVGPNFTYGDGSPIFKKTQRLYHNHCSVPIIFNLSEWEEVFKHYLEICHDGRQNQNGNIKGIGDIHAWNISVQKCDKQNDVIVFPMEVMCQVHKRHINPLTYIQVENDYWYTFSGDPIYSIQGRWNTNIDFVEGSLKYLKENSDEKTYKAVAGKIRNGLEAIQQEWYDLNYNSTLNLSEYEDSFPGVETFNRRGNQND